MEQKHCSEATTPPPFTDNSFTRIRQGDTRDNIEQLPINNPLDEDHENHKDNVWDHHIESVEKSGNPSKSFGEITSIPYKDTENVIEIEKRVNNVNDTSITPILEINPTENNGFSSKNIHTSGVFHSDAEFPIISNLSKVSMLPGYFYHDQVSWNIFKIFFMWFIYKNI